MCPNHGGATPAVRAAAERRRAEAEAQALLGLIWDPQAAPVADPVSALAALAGKLQHAADVLGARVSTASELDGPAGLAWSRVLRELRQSLEGLERLGLQERQVRISEAAGQQLASVVRLVLDRMFAVVVEAVGEERALEAALEMVWQEGAMRIVPEELRRLSPAAERPGHVVIKP